MSFFHKNGQINIFSWRIDDKITKNSETKTLPNTKKNLLHISTLELKKQEERES